jgi:hypothetical protein
LQGGPGAHQKTGISSSFLGSTATQELEVLPHVNPEIDKTPLKRTSIASQNLTVGNISSSMKTLRWQEL